MHPALVGIVVLIAMFALAGALLWLNDRMMDRVRRDRRSPEKRAEEEAKWRARLLNPGWDEVARLTGGAPSPAILDLYADRDLLLSEDLTVRVSPSGDGGLHEEIISTFLPADGETLGDPWYQYLPQGALPVARDFTGDLIFVELDSEGRDAPVKHWYHDGGDIESVAPSLERFLVWCRESIRASSG